jgi:RNA polymerase sigma factor (TIGR02999 family)
MKPPKAPRARHRSPGSAGATTPPAEPIGSIDAVGEALSASARRLLSENNAPDERAISQLLPVVYDELRRLARNYLRRERPGQTLQATALVHEAYLRLLKDKSPGWQNRTHFVAIAAVSMRQILVERARARHALKRGGQQVRVTLDDARLGKEEAGVDLLVLDQALTRLTRLDPQQARIVELRYFAGSTIEETAEALGISPATVKRDWTMAKAWLKRELKAPPSDEETAEP